MAAFFTVHDDGLRLGHGVFLTIAFASDGWSLEAVGTGRLSLMVSHGVSFVRIYLWREHEWAVPMAEMFKPHGRVVALHLVILAGGFGVRAGGSPLWGWHFSLCSTPPSP